jgi:hypothetical protein
MTVVSDSHHQSTLDDVYVYVVSWSEFPIVPSYPHYPQGGGGSSLRGQTPARLWAGRALRKLAVHMRTYTREKLHGCEMCGRAFSTSGYMAPAGHSAAEGFTPVFTCIRAAGLGFSV